MSTPPRQAALRSPRSHRPDTRRANSAEHQAWLTSRLTGRDRWLIAMLHEHRVLTSGQIAACAFPTRRAAQQRLLELYHWSVLDRFQPFLPVGSAPMHYILGPAGATTLAAEHGVETSALGYRRLRAVGLAHSLQLAHTLGVNDFFTHLLAHARRDPGLTVTAWWSQARCTHHYGDLVRPDAYGRLHHHGPVEFFLEHDTGTEALTRVAGKLHSYHQLAAATGITTPVLIWLPSTAREATARRTLQHTWADLEHPHTVPVATATPTRATTGSPAEPIWLPLHHHGHRHRPAQLLQAWPEVHPPDTPLEPPEATGTERLLPAPPPRAPVPQHRTAGHEG